MRCLCSVLLLNAVLAMPGDAQQRVPYAVFVELAGSGGVASANYERVLYGPLALRAGVGFTPSFIEAPPMLFLPLMPNVVFGKGRGKVEIGGGPIFRYRLPEKNVGYVSPWAETLVGGIIGYRYESGRPGVLWRVAFTPYHGTHEGWRRNEWFPLIGVSLGGSF